MNRHRLSVNWPPSILRSGSRACRSPSHSCLGAEGRLRPGQVVSNFPLHSWTNLPNARFFGLREEGGQYAKPTDGIEPPTLLLLRPQCQWLHLQVTNKYPIIQHFSTGGSLLPMGFLGRVPPCFFFFLKKEFKIYAFIKEYNFCRTHNSIG